MTAPLVTIGITCFNAASTVERAINSALAQTWRPIEVVIVDDYSADRSRQVIVNLAERHSELRVFYNDANLGVAATRNRILQEAKGEFVAFFDDDDESLPERVSAQLRRILDYERDFAAGAPVICHTARRQKFPHGGDRIEPTMGENEKRCAPAGPPVARRILFGASLKDAYGSCATCSQMARLSTYRSLAGFDENLRRSSDTELNIRLAEVGGHFAGIGKPLVVQTMTKTSEKSLTEEFRNFLMMMEKHRGIIEGAEQYEFCRKWIGAKQAWLEGRRRDFAVTLISLAVSHPILTARRLSLAIPNIGLNNAFSRFHTRSEG